MSLHELKRDLCLGRLIWMKANSEEEASSLSRTILKEVGFHHSEILFLTALQFTCLSLMGFPPELLSKKRVILIQNLPSLSGAMTPKFLKQLSRHRDFKHRYELSLVISSSEDWSYPDSFNELFKTISLREFSLSEWKEIEMDSEIHDWIESASKRIGKRVFRLTESAAVTLEGLFMKSDKLSLKRLVYLAVMNSKNGKITQEDIDVARQREHPLSF